MKGVLTGHPSRGLAGRTVLGMNPSYDLSGQVALVTGASSGMGLATAKAFAEAGAAVVLADVNEAALGAAADALTAAGHQALGVRCDFSQEDQVDAMLDRAVANFGLHETRAATHAHPGQRRHRQLLLPGRSRRTARPRRIPRLKARGHRLDPQRRPGVRRGIRINAVCPGTIDYTAR